MATAPGFVIGSWHFALISILAIVFFRAVRTTFQRQLVLLVFNLYFISLLLAGPSSAAVLGTFLLGTYVLAAWRRRSIARWSAFGTVAIIIGFWFFLFCVRDHELFFVFNPFRHSLVTVIGISYIVFRAISYYLDADVIADPGMLSFVNYSLFFPSLLSGPIARFEEFEVSVEKPLPMNLQIFLESAHRLVWGMLKKFVIAESLNVLLPAEATLHQTNTPSLWLGTMLSLAALYFDFSGYCDIVLALARLMGCHLPENFNAPFMSRNIQEFWTRWHMSLSSIIRDYFFMPMTKWMYSTFPKQNRLVLITVVYAICMMLIAVWHGTTEGYVLYGALHAGALILLQIERKISSKKAVLSFRQTEAAANGVRDWAARILTYSFVSISITLSDFSGDSLWYLIRRLVGQ